MGACIEAATKVYLGREYGPLFDDADCTTTGDPTSCARPAAAVEEDYYTFPFDDSEQLALESWATTEPDADTVKNCYIEINADDPCEEATCLPPFFPRKTFRECATSCAETDARENARTAVQAIDDATDLFQISTRSSMRKRVLSCSASSSRMSSPTSLCRFARSR